VINSAQKAAIEGIAMNYSFNTTALTNHPIQCFEMPVKFKYYLIVKLLKLDY